MDPERSLQRTTLVVVMTTSFASTFLGSSINLAIPAIAADFSSGAVLISWIVTSYLLASAALLLPFGHLADMIGRKRLYVTGTFLLGISTLLCVFAPSANILIILRICQGLASSMIFGTGMAILTSVYPPRERGRVLGLSSAATYIGLSVGPVAGGWMSGAFGWRSIFLAVFIICTLACGLAIAKLKDDFNGLAGQQLDTTGSLLYAFGLTAFLFGLSSLNSLLMAPVSAIAGAVLLVLFVLYELRKIDPILNMRIFKNNHRFTFANLSAMINYSAMFAISFILSLYLQLVSGFPSQTAGFILLAQPVCMAIFSPLAGRISDRRDPGIVSAFGMGLSGLGLMIFIFLSPQFPVWLIVANLILIGIGVAFFASPNSNAIIGSVSKEFYGVASSSLGTARIIGQALSMAIVTLLTGFFVGNITLADAPAQQLLLSFRTAFILFSILSLFGIWTSLVSTKTKPQKAVSF
ncbi:MAG TPA: MFS transporter [Syntrophomonadaceae bacterium]|nr:MFS transporter [Syntrophomonadaceae bacterium]